MNYEDQLAALQIELVKFPRLGARHGPTHRRGLRGAGCRGQGRLHRAGAPEPETRGSRGWWRCRNRPEREDRAMVFPALHPSSARRRRDPDVRPQAGTTAAWSSMSSASARPKERQIVLPPVCPITKKMLVDDGIRLTKIWLNVGRAEQLRPLFSTAKRDPLKQWKLSWIDVEGLKKMGHLFRRHRRDAVGWAHTAPRALDGDPIRRQSAGPGLP